MSGFILIFGKKLEKKQKKELRSERKMKPGSKVFHQKLGTGVILTMEKRNRAMVLFFKKSEFLARIGSVKDLIVIEENNENKN